MRILKTKWFERFARKHRISDRELLEAIREVDAGKIDADLGGGVIKQRIARPGKGKSGGYRAILFFRSGDRAIIVYGFAKSRRATLREDEVQGFKKLAEVMLSYDSSELDAALESGTLTEVKRDGEDISE